MERVNADQLPECVGKIIVMFNTKKLIGKIDRVDVEEGFLYYTEIGGDDDGGKFKLRYDQNGQNLKIFEESEEVLAVLE